jgi:hypothetical protein
VFPFPGDDAIALEGRLAVARGGAISSAGSVESPASPRKWENHETAKVTRELPRVKRGLEFLHGEVRELRFDPRQTGSGQQSLEDVLEKNGGVFQPALVAIHKEIPNHPLFALVEKEAISGRLIAQAQGVPSQPFLIQTTGDQTP